MKNNYRRFIWKGQKKRIALVLVLLGLVLIMVAMSQGAEKNLNWWSKWLDPFFGVGTLLVALLVWATELRQDWTDNLPKRLTVKFNYGNRTILECREAYLASEGDIRTWGQQIGKQMTNVQFLHFEPFIEEKEIEIQKDKKEHYRLYEVTFYLTDYPQLSENEKRRLSDEPDKIAEIEDTLMRLKNDCLIWQKNTASETKSKVIARWKSELNE